jgi:hypothetical protein
MGAVDGLQSAKERLQIFRRYFTKARVSLLKILSLKVICILMKKSM